MLCTIIVVTALIYGFGLLAHSKLMEIKNSVTESVEFKKAVDYIQKIFY